MTNLFFFILKKVICIQCEFLLKPPTHTVAAPEHFILLTEQCTLHASYVRLHTGYGLWYSRFTNV